MTLGRFSCRSFLLAAVLQASGAVANVYFCQFLCEGQIESNCFQEACPTAAPGCEYYASQAFVSSTVCFQYFQSGPTCNGTTHECNEAANFQLVFDRLADAQRAYGDQDWTGFSMVFDNWGALFVPGSTSFIFGREAVANGSALFFNKSHSDRFGYTMHKVMTVDGDNGKALHAIGTWMPEPLEERFPLFTRWVSHRAGHWVIDTFLGVVPSASRQLASMAPPSDQDDLYDSISDRQEEFARLYNSQDFAGLVAAMYTKDAAVVGVDGTMAAKDDLVPFFAKSPLKDNVKLNSKIVALTPEIGGVVHEIGFSDSTRSGYYARWVRRIVGEVEGWAMELHVFAVFPPVPEDMALVV